MLGHQIFEIPKPGIYDSKGGTIPDPRYFTRAFALKTSGTWGRNTKYTGPPPTIMQQKHYGWLNAQRKKAMSTPAKIIPQNIIVGPLPIVPEILPRSSVTLRTQSKLVVPAYPAATDPRWGTVTTAPRSKRIKTVIDQNNEIVDTFSPYYRPGISQEGIRYIEKQAKKEMPVLHIQPDGTVLIGPDKPTFLPKTSPATTFIRCFKAPCPTYTRPTDLKLINEHIKAIEKTLVKKRSLIRTADVTRNKYNEWVHPSDVELSERLYELKQAQQNAKFRNVVRPLGEEVKTVAPELIIQPLPEFATNAFISKQSGFYGANKNYTGSPPTQAQKNHYGWLNKKMKEGVTSETVIYKDTEPKISKTAMGIASVIGLVFLSKAGIV